MATSALLIELVKSYLSTAKKLNIKMSVEDAHDRVLKIREIDPTPSAKYTKWLVGRDIAGWKDPAHDDIGNYGVEKLRKIIEGFDEASNKYHSYIPDINTFADVGQLTSQLNQITTELASASTGRTEKDPGVSGVEPKDNTKQFVPIVGIPGSAVLKTQIGSEAEFINQELPPLSGNSQQDVIEYLHNFLLSYAKKFTTDAGYKVKSALWLTAVSIKDLIKKFPPSDQYKEKTIQEQKQGKPAKERETIDLENKIAQYYKKYPNLKDWFLDASQHSSDGAGLRYDMKKIGPNKVQPTGSNLPKLVRETYTEKDAKKYDEEMWNMFDPKTYNDMLKERISRMEMIIDRMINKGWPNPGKDPSVSADPERGTPADDRRYAHEFAKKHYNEKLVNLEKGGKKLSEKEKKELWERCLNEELARWESNNPPKPTTTNKTKIKKDLSKPHNISDIPDSAKGRWVIGPDGNVTTTE